MIRSQSQFRLLDALRFFDRLRNLIRKYKYKYHGLHTLSASCKFCPRNSHHIVPILFEHFRIAYFHPSVLLVSITKCSWINNKMFYEIFLFTRFNFSTRQSFLCIEFYTTAKIVWERKLSAKLGKRGKKSLLHFCHTEMAIFCRIQLALLMLFGCFALLIFVFFFMLNAETELFMSLFG